MIMNKRKIQKTAVIYIIFIIFSLIQGIVYSFKLPFAQVPDELSHYENMETAFGTSGYTSELVSRLYHPAKLNSLPGNKDAKVNQSALNKVALAHFSDSISLSSFHPRTTILRYLPCGIGFYLGIAMDLPILWCTYLAELFSVLFFVILGYYTLKIVPVKKEIFAFCMLIPETLQQCSSVNYDSVLIPCCFFLFAYIIKLYYDNAPIRWRNLLVVFLFTLILVIVKLPYAFISLTIFIVPLRRFQLKIGHRFDLIQFIHKFWYVLVLLLIVVAGIGLYLFRDNSLVKVFLSDILSFSQFSSLIERTYSGLGYYHIIQMIGMFGWIDSQVSTMFILIFFMMMVYLNSTLNEDVETKLNTSRRIWLFVVFVLMILLIEVIFQRWSYNYWKWDLTGNLSTYQSYIPALGTILGVQGRYWIPCLPILLVALHGQVQHKHRKLFWFIQIAYYTISFIHVINILNTRYWI